MPTNFENWKEELTLEALADAISEDVDCTRICPLYVDLCCARYRGSCSDNIKEWGKEEFNDHS